MRFSKTVVKCRVPILIITILLLIPAVFGYINTRVNYDMLDYLPQNMETVIGQKKELLPVPACPAPGDPGKARPRRNRKISELFGLPV